MLVVDTVKGLDFMGPLLMALASKVARHQVLVKKLDVPIFTCYSRESAQSIAALVEHSESVQEENYLQIRIFGMSEREERDLAIQRATEHVSDTFGLKVVITQAE